MLDHLKFQARVQGVEIKDTDTQQDEEVKEVKEVENLMVFKDPKEYEHLSVEAKKELTAKMKGIHLQNLKLG